MKIEGEMTREEAALCMRLYQMQIKGSVSIGIEKDIEAFDMAIRALEQELAIDMMREKGITNQEYIANLPPEKFWDSIVWLQREYGKRYADSRRAILDWLSAEVKCDE